MEHRLPISSSDISRAIYDATYDLMEDMEIHQYPLYIQWKKPEMQTRLIYSYSLLCFNTQCNVEGSIRQETLFSFIPLHLILSGFSNTPFPHPRERKAHGTVYGHTGSTYGFCVFCIISMSEQRERRGGGEYL